MPPILRKRVKRDPPDDTHPRQELAETFTETTRRKRQKRDKLKTPKKVLSKTDAKSDGTSLAENTWQPKRKFCEIISSVTYVSKLMRGEKPSRKLEECLKSPLEKNIKHLQVQTIAVPFDRRVTALTWHPKFLNTLAVGSKGGDIALWKYELPKPNIIVKGQGPGGSIQAMKFDANYGNYLYTASVDGTLCKKDLEGNNTLVFLSNERWKHWFTSLDVSAAGDVLVYGDNLGFVHVLDKEGKLTGKFKFHKGKVTHVELNKRNPWLLATSSVERKVKLWDLRFLQGSDVCSFKTLQHDQAVSSAYFSLCHGTRLLTTDQHSQINVFSGPLWELETQIAHPHRRFQHLTQIKAHWHPLEDIVIVGRYPDPKFPSHSSREARTIDFFDVPDGKLIYQLKSDLYNGIVSLNEFDPIGNALASAMGYHVVLWKPGFRNYTSRKSYSVQNAQPGPTFPEDVKKKKR